MISRLSDPIMNINDITSILDETQQKLTFNHKTLSIALENIDYGICVINRQLKLVVWNTAYTNLFNYPKDLLSIGLPIIEIIRYNAKRGWCGSGSIDNIIKRRLEKLHQGKRHVYERLLPDGRYIRLVGAPLRYGGYVTSFSDITRNKLKEHALASANEELEHRVKQRTKSLEISNMALKLAKQSAEKANARKTAFLAAASHDLLQPLNASRLFVSALREHLKEEDVRHTKSLTLLNNIDRSIHNAGQLLKALLDISRLDQGVVQANPTGFPVNRLLENLKREFLPIAREKNIELRIIESNLWIFADFTLIYSVLQNLLSNALRYTEKGRVLLTIRRKGEQIQLNVIDTGCGIAKKDQKIIFKEFQRLKNNITSNKDPGVGLGLSIVKRIANLMNCPTGLESKIGKGSCFYIITCLYKPVKTSPPLLIEYYPKKKDDQS